MRSTRHTKAPQSAAALLAEYPARLHQLPALISPARWVVIVARSPDDATPDGLLRRRSVAGITNLTPGRRTVDERTARWACAFLAHGGTVGFIHRDLADAAALLASLKQGAA